MPVDPPIPDYSTKTKSELVELLTQRDTALVERPTIQQLDEARARAETALAELARRDAEVARAEELKAARLAERDKALASKAPPKLLGTVQVYLQDSPEDIVERARALFAGQIPADRARRFKVDARLILSREWPLAKRIGTSPPIGAEFDADELPPKERVEYAAAGAIVAIG